MDPSSNSPNAPGENPKETSVAAIALTIGTQPEEVRTDSAPKVDPEAVEMRRLGKAWTKNIVHPISFQSIPEFFWRAPQKAVGSMLCLEACSASGPSLGLPVDLLGVVARQVIFNRFFQIPTLVLDVDSSASRCRRVLTREESRLLEKSNATLIDFVQHVSAYLKSAESRITVVASDTESLDQEAHSQAQAEVERNLRENPQLVLADQVIRERIVRMEALRIQYGARARVGWSSINSRKRPAELERTQSQYAQAHNAELCDGYIDAYLQQSFPERFACVYAPPAECLEVSMHVSPITVNPIYERDSSRPFKPMRDGDGRLLHGRILLDDVSSFDALVYGAEEIGNEMADPIKRDQNRARYARCINYLFDTAHLVRVAMPGLRTPVDAALASQFSSAEQQYSDLFQRARVGVQSSTHSLEELRVEVQRSYLRLTELKRLLVLPQLEHFARIFAPDHAQSWEEHTQRRFQYEESSIGLAA
ncbi:MAG: hypothetical protein K1X83_07210 [Oligoflexia bacterium]|nr:hypothetical protein [Oligoflexia bacterium]